MVSERKRRREVHRLFPSYLRGADLSERLRSDTIPLPPEGFTPRPSQDDALTLFAQTVCHRLGVARAFISLLDGENQFILAESSPGILFRKHEETGQEDSDQRAEPLWLGNVCIPRHRGFCRASLAIEQRLSPLVIPDLAAHPEYKDAWCVEGYPYWRFYAAYPLYGSQDAIVGDVCVFDHEARPDGVTLAETRFLDGMSGTITKYLETLRVNRDQARHERMINGLLSFDEGSSDPPAPVSSGSDSTSPGPRRRQDLPNAENAQSHDRSHSNPTVHQSFTGMQATPSQASFAHKRTTMFQRATSILCQACNVDGVALIDASVAAMGIDRHGKGREVQVSGTNEPATFNPDMLDNQNILRKLSSASSCGYPETSSRVMASSTTNSDAAETDGESITISNTLLRRAIRQYPRGQAFEFVPDSPFSDTAPQDADEEEDGRVLIHSIEKAQQLGIAEVSKALLGQEIRKLGRDVQNFVFLPLWNYESMKWCSCIVLWTEQTQADSFDHMDFTYLRTFGNSILMEQSRLHAIEVDRMKTSFVASISHELRTPLHGLLGAAELMQNTPVDLFQSSMLDIIQGSGKTLLDVLEHVLDYSKITQPETSATTNGSLDDVDTNALESSHMQTFENQTNGDVSVNEINVAQVTEEVIDSVVGGRARHIPSHRTHGEKSYLRENDSSEEAPQTHSSISSFQSSGDQVQLILQIDPMNDEAVRLAVGSWRRIVMNLVSNALKYTRSGHILIRLNRTANPDRIRLSVEDTGVGMSETFMSDGARNAFTQENPFAPGLGLGLHITQQLVTSLNGVMNIRSVKGIGTQITVEVGLPDNYASTAFAHSEIRDQVKQDLNGRGISLLHTRATNRHSDALTDDETHEVDAVKATLQDWFNTEAEVKECLDERSDIVFCIRPTAEEIHRAIMTRPENSQQRIIIASVSNTADALILQKDARLAKSGHILMTLLHPLGPFKIAKALRSCLDRLENQSLIDQNSSVQSQPLPVAPEGNDDAPIHHEIAAQVRPVECNGRQFADCDSESTPPSKTDQFTTMGTDIMIVDDNDVNRRILAALIKTRNRHLDLNLSYSQASNGLEALNMYKANPHQWKLILMDISMPVMDGLTAAREIRAFEEEHGLGKTSIVAVTGLTDKGEGKGVLDGYLTKPVKLDKLMGLLQ